MDIINHEFFSLWEKNINFVHFRDWNSTRTIEFFRESKREIVRRDKNESRIFYLEK